MQTLDKHLQQYLSKCDWFNIATATLGASGWRKIAPIVEDAVKRGAVGQMIIGLDMLTTDPAALTELINLQALYRPGLKVRVFRRGGGIFHPKVAIFGTSRRRAVVIGSSNLSGAAFNDKINVECDVVLSDRTTVNQIEKAYLSYWNSRFCKPLDSHTLEDAKGLWLKRGACKPFLDDNPKPPPPPPPPPPQTIPDRIKGYIFVFTGAYSTRKDGRITRPKLLALIESYGGVFVDTAPQTRNADCLVNCDGHNPNGGDTRKLEAAKAFGVPRLKPTKFSTLLANEDRIRKVEAANEIQK